MSSIEPPQNVVPGTQVHCRFAQVYEIWPVEVELVCTQEEAAQ